MEQFLNPLTTSIQISGIRQFYNLIADIDDVISFTIGEPDFNTPEHIKTAAINAIHANHTIYTPNAGLLKLREAASTYFNRKYHLNYSANEIIVTVGASEALDIALRSILKIGDEVLIPSPVYPGYEPIVTTCGAKTVHIDTRESFFKVTPEQIEAHLTEKTKCIILTYPSNPTGVTLTEAELTAIADVLRGRNILVITDEIYSELTEEHFSIATLLREQTLVVNGLSKSHSMTGWRIGFLLAPAAICKHLLKVHQYNVTCSSSISQYAAIEALTNGFDDPIPMRLAYENRRRYVDERLKKMGFETVYPDGAFYFFVKLPINSKENSMEFALNLVKNAKVAVVPGSAFSPVGEGYFRLSYACSMENIVEGLNRMEAYLHLK